MSAVNKPALPKPGETWGSNVAGDEFRVMGVIENWVMYRRPRCAPYIRHVNEFVMVFKRIRGKR